MIKQEIGPMAGKNMLRNVARNATVSIRKNLLAEDIYYVIHCV